MGKRIKNMIDSWVTTLLGVATIVLTLVLIYRGTFDFLWEGVAGLVTGSILIVAPKTIEQKLSEFIRAWGGKASEASSSTEKTTLLD